MSVAGFRSEIVETFKILHELNKLKIVLTSGLMAIAFGVGGVSRVGDAAFLSLSMIPFLCVYLDFQHYHALAKIFVLARFLSNMSSGLPEARLVQQYEAFVHRVRETDSAAVFSFESKAQLGSSIVLSLLCPNLGVLALMVSPSPGSYWIISILALSSIMGVIFTFWFFWSNKKQLNSMAQVEVGETADAVVDVEETRDD